MTIMPLYVRARANGPRRIFLLRLILKSRSSGARFELVRDLGAAEFLKFVVPRQFGGARDAIQARDLCILREELARGDALADTMLALQALGGYPIARFGSAAQKRRYLGDAASGAAIAAFALTEPEAGSDAASMQTRAMRRDGEFFDERDQMFHFQRGHRGFLRCLRLDRP